MLLKDLVTIKGGKRLPKGKMLVQYKTAHPYIKVKDMEFKTIEINSTFEYVEEDIFQSIKRYTVESGKVILSIVGTIGNVSIVGDTLNNASLTENCVKFDCNKMLLSKYLFYFLCSRKGQIEIQNGVVGTTQPKLPIYNIEKININVPSIEQQQHIVNTISSLLLKSL